MSCFDEFDAVVANGDEDSVKKNLLSKGETSKLTRKKKETFLNKSNFSKREYFLQIPTLYKQAKKNERPEPEDGHVVGQRDWIRRNPRRWVGLLVLVRTRRGYESPKAIIPHWESEPLF